MTKYDTPSNSKTPKSPTKNMALRSSFVAVGCNRDPEAMDWFVGVRNEEYKKDEMEGMVAYGANSMVALYDPFKVMVLPVYVKYASG